MQIITRKRYLETLGVCKGKGLIKVVSGLRRSEKSILLELFQNHLLIQGFENLQIQFCNFELPENDLNKTWSDNYSR